MREFNGIRPQDIAVLLKRLTTPSISQKELSESLEISQAEISHGLKRLKIIKLINSDGQTNLEAVVEFLVHALKYVCPVELGTLTVGIPTAFAKPGFRFVKYNKNDIYVWPHANGKEKGTAILPIYPTLVRACLNDDKLYTLASLVEMIRVGRQREQKLAAEELKNTIMDLK